MAEGYEPGDLALYDAGTQTLVVRVEEIEPGIKGAEDAPDVDTAVVTRLSANEGTIRVNLRDLSPVSVDPENLPAEYLERVDGRLADPDTTRTPDPDESETASGWLSRLKSAPSSLTGSAPETAEAAVEQASLDTIGDVYEAGVDGVHAAGVGEHTARHIWANARAVIEGDIDRSMRHRPERSER